MDAVRRVAALVGRYASSTGWPFTPPACVDLAHRQLEPRQQRGCRSVAAGPDVRQQDADPERAVEVAPGRGGGGGRGRAWTWWPSWRCRRVVQAARDEHQCREGHGTAQHRAEVYEAPTGRRCRGRPGRAESVPWPPSCCTCATPTCATFDATVVDGRRRRSPVALDRTAFYPTGGGQPHDTGTLGGLHRDRRAQGGRPASGTPSTATAPARGRRRRCTARSTGTGATP